MDIDVGTAFCNIQPDCLQQDVDEEDIALSWDVSFGQKDLVVTTLHEILFHGDRMFEINIALDLVDR